MERAIHPTSSSSSTNTNVGSSTKSQSQNQAQTVSASQPQKQVEQPKWIIQNVISRALPDLPCSVCCGTKSPGSEFHRGVENGEGFSESDFDASDFALPECLDSCGFYLEPNSLRLEPQIARIRFSFLCFTAEIRDVEAGSQGVPTNIPTPLSPWLAYFGLAPGGLSITTGVVPKFLAMLTKLLPLIAIPALPYLLIGVGSLLVVLALFRIAFHIALRMTITGYKAF